MPTTLNHSLYNHLKKSLISIIEGIIAPIITTNVKLHLKEAEILLCKVVNNCKPIKTATNSMVFFMEYKIRG